MNIKKEEVIIVVPIYKMDIDKTEEISLCQLFRVLDKYDISFVAPMGLEIDFEILKGRKYQVEYFACDYFKDIEGYSNLCTSEEFYKRFSTYKFMLLYQLDAFVFKDSLLDYCNKDFDFIGAPVPYVFWKEMDTRIGNGGFSLRKISTMLEISKRKYEILGIIKDKKSPKAVEELIRNEDKFIAFSLRILKDDGVNIKFPSESEAFRFSTEFNIDNCYKNIEKQIPFGTHRWHKYRFDTWWPIIEKYGYTLSDEEKKYLREENQDQMYINCLLQNRIDTNDKYVQQVIEVISKGHFFSIWGLGKQYENYKKDIDSLGIIIKNQYDKNEEKLNINVKYPSEKNLLLEKYPIIITTSKYIKEISEELNKVGKIRGIDFFTFEDIKEYLVEKLLLDELGEVGSGIKKLV